MGKQAIWPNTPPPVTTTDVRTPSRPRDSRMPESGLGGTGGGGNEAENPCQQAMSLPIGTWYRFTEGDQCMDAQLSWRSMGGAVMIFTNGKGQRVRVLSAIAAEELLQTGTLYSLHRHTL